MSSNKKWLFEQKFKNSRRNFLKLGLMGVGGVAALSAVPGCSTFDELIFEDRKYLKDQVVIIGGGLSGLYLAYKLRQTKTEFHLFEGSRKFGGRIKSVDGLELGASVFGQTDINLKKLIKEFNLSETALSKSKFYFTGGAEQLVDALKDRVSGLMPYRNVRLGWRFVEITKTEDRFKLIFETPDGRRSLVTKKMALTIPPSQWAGISGLLDLPEMAWAKTWLQTLQPESIFKMVAVVPSNTTALAALSKKLKSPVGDGPENLSAVVKNLKNAMSAVEFELSNTQILNQQTYRIQEQAAPSIEGFIAFINTKTKLALNSKKIANESFFNWSDLDLNSSAYYRNPVPMRSVSPLAPSAFQIFGDYSSLEKPHTAEGALLEAEQVSSLFV